MAKFTFKAQPHRRDDAGKVVERRSLTLNIEAPDQDHAHEIAVDMLATWGNNLSVEDLVLKGEKSEKL